MLIALMGAVWQCQGAAAPVAAATFDASVVIDVAGTVSAVNRAILGVGMNRGPFDPDFLALWDGVLDGTSARIWVMPPKSGEPIRRKLLETSLQALRAACQLGIKERNGFSAGVPKIGRLARYRSAADNNLDKVHQPETVAQLVGAVNAGNDCPVTGWEVWNEPQFAKKGSWPAEDMAQYAVDVAKAIHRLQPTLRIGVPLYERDMAWNRRLLAKLNELGPEQIAFFSFHPYWFDWNVPETVARREASRAVGPSAMRDLAVGEKLALIKQYGGGRWSASATEWNIHPKGLNSPAYKLRMDRFEASTDMVAALHLSEMIGVFADKGLGSAQFFDFRAEEDGHFHLAYRDAGTYRLNPTGMALRLYGRYFRGERLPAKAQTPSTQAYGYGGGSANAPLVFAQAVRHTDLRQFALFVGNRDPARSASIAVRWDRFPAGDWTFKVTTLRAPLSDLRAAATSEHDLMAGATADGARQLALDVPANGLTVVIARARGE
ncbi:MAG: hypothetical protein Q8Q73_11200 [Stagnimonas sp.]|nr:hypothetical protein [Stagnimonas sp.]